MLYIKIVINMIEKIDVERGRRVASLLYNSFSTTGIFGKTDMPEDLIPKSIVKGSLEHILFITLTVSIDYQRDAPSLWQSARKTFEDPETRYLFYPVLLHETPASKIIKDLQKYGLSKKPRRDAGIWITLGETFYKKWNSDPRNFLEGCGWNSLLILKHLKRDMHLENGRWTYDYPNLRGDKIGPLWLRVLRDNIGITQLKNLEKVPIPVDVHIARATLTTGVVRGEYEGRLEDLFECVRKAWFESVEGLNTGTGPMIALDVDEPLWHLSKYGCSKNRDKNTGYCSLIAHCEAREFCIKGKVKIGNGFVELKT